MAFSYYLARTLPARAWYALRYRLRSALLWERRYAGLREPNVREGIPDGVEFDTAVRAELERAGIRVCEYQVDPDDYHAYLAKAEYRQYRTYLHGGHAAVFPEKSYEHYLAATLLALQPGDTYIDIANDRSPAPDIYRRLYGCTAYRQDIVFAPGVHGDSIGSDAATLPVEDGFASAMALHCSLEHFEGDADIGFVREAARVLRRGGRVCIVPLYMSTKYSILTDPAVLPRGSQPFEHDAVLHCVRGYGNRHGRYYDGIHLARRIIDNLGPLDFTVYYFSNMYSVEPRCHVRFSVVMRRLQSSTGTLRSCS